MKWEGRRQTIAPIQTRFQEMTVIVVVEELPFAALTVRNDPQALGTGAHRIGHLGDPGFTAERCRANGVDRERHRLGDRDYPARRREMYPAWNDREDICH
jgi:hypothetical protein